MNAFKNLKSLFLVEEKEDGAKAPADSTKKSPAKSKTSSSPKKPALTGTPTPTMKGPVGGQVESRIVDTLLKVIEKNNLDGFDYLEFKKSLQSMEKMSIDEATRFKSAFATASTIGVTLTNLVDTANHYVGILDEEKKKFAATVTRNETQMVQQKKADIKSMIANIKTKEEHIAQLQKEIEADKAKADKMKSEIDASQGKIELTKNNFEKSFLSLRSQFVADIEKMKKYLK